MVAFLDKALSNDSKTNAPAPLPGTKPEALALMGLEPFSGLSLCLYVVTLIASKPAQEYKLLSLQLPTNMRLAFPFLMRSKPNKMASVPVVQAEELLVI